MLVGDRAMGMASREVFLGYIVSVDSVYVLTYCTQFSKDLSNRTRHPI